MDLGHVALASHLVFPSGKQSDLLIAQSAHLLAQRQTPYLLRRRRHSEPSKAFSRGIMLFVVPFRLDDEQACL